jgi:hypothetical protein
MHNLQSVIHQTGALCNWLQSPTAEVLAFSRLTGLFRSATIAYKLIKPLQIMLDSQRYMVRTLKRRARTAGTSAVFLANVRYSNYWRGQNYTGARNTITT